MSKAVVPDGTESVVRRVDAQPDFNGVPAQALEAVRMRLAQLTHSLRRIRDELHKSELGQWHSLQSLLNLTLSQLASVTATLQHFEETLGATVVYPTILFPTTSHESLLATLLRKKRTPEVEAWFNEARETAGLNPQLVGEEEIARNIREDRDVTQWALETFAKEFEKRPDEIPWQLNQRVHRESPFEIENVLAYMHRGQKP